MVYKFNNGKSTASTYPEFSNDGGALLILAGDYDESAVGTMHTLAVVDRTVGRHLWTKF